MSVSEKQRYVILVDVVLQVGAEPALKTVVGFCSVFKL